MIPKISHLPIAQENERSFQTSRILFAARLRGRRIFVKSLRFNHRERTPTIVERRKVVGRDHPLALSSVGPRVLSAMSQLPRPNLRSMIMRL